MIVIRIYYSDFLLFKQKEFVMKNIFPIYVFDKNPKAFGASMHSFVPLKIFIRYYFVLCGSADNKLIIVIPGEIDSSTFRADRVIGKI